MSVVSALAAKILSSYLGDYVDGLDKKNLEVSVISGETQFTNLSVKPSALDGLELPVTLKRGSIQKVRAKIPWRNLGSEPVIVSVEGINIVVGPKTKSNADLAEAELRRESTKLRALEVAELLGLDAADTEEAKKLAEEKRKKNEDGFLESLKMKIINNLQIFVDGIHIRYEDDQANPEQPFAFGITLEHFHAQSTDGNWNPTFLKLKEEIQHKLVTLKNLAVYWDTPADKAVHVSQMGGTVEQVMDKLIYRDGATPPPPHQYIVKPISGALKANVYMGNEVKLDRPLLSLNFELEDVTLGINRYQFTSILDILQYFVLYARGLKYLKYRPPVQIRPKDDPKRWWKFAILSVRSNVRQKYYKWSWEYIKQRKVDRTAYVDIYTRKQRGKKLSSSDKQTLEELDRKLSYDDIILYRKLSNAAIELRSSNKKKEKEREKERERAKKDEKARAKAEKEAKKKEKEKQKKEKEKSKSKDKDKSSSSKKDKTPGFFDRFFSSSSSSKDKEKDKKATTSEKESSLSGSSSSIGSSSATPPTSPPSSSSVSRTSTASQVIGTEDEATQALKELYSAIGYDDSSKVVTTVYPKEYIKTVVQFHMKRAAFEIRETPAENSIVALASFSDLNVKLGLREGDSMTLNTRLKTFQVTDHFTLRPGSRRVGDGDGTIVPVVFPDPDRVTKNDDLLFVDVEVAPPVAESVDLKLSAKVLPLCVLFSRPLMDRLVYLFTPNAEAVNSLHEVVTEVANDTMEKVIDRAQKSIKYALERRRVIQIDVDVMAPRVSMPENLANEESSAVMLDLGHFTLATDSSGILKSTQTSIDEGYFYDTFRMDLKGITALLIKDRSKSVNWEDSRFFKRNSLIDKFDLNFILSIATVATPDIPKLKLVASLPSIQIELTREKVQDALNVVKGIISSIEEEQAPLVVTAAENNKRRKSNRLSKNAADLIKRQVLDTKNRDKLVNFVLDIDKVPKGVLLAGENLLTEATEPDLPRVDGKYKRAPAVQVRRLLADIEFELGRVSINLTQTIDVDNSPTFLPVVGIDMRQVKAKVLATNQDVKVKFALAGLFIEDMLAQHSSDLRHIIEAREQEAGEIAPTSVRATPAVFNVPTEPVYIFKSGSMSLPSLEDSGLMSKAQALILVDILLVDYRSPQYQNVDATVTAKLGAIDVTVCRPTIAAVLQVATDVASILDTSTMMEMPVSVATANLDESSSEESVEVVPVARTPDLARKRKNRPIRSGEYLLAKISVSLSSVNIALRKDNSNFLALALTNMSAGVEARPNGITHIEGDLGNISVRDLQLPKWADIVSLNGDKVVSFGVDIIDPYGPTYEGYEVALDVKVASLKFVGLARVFAELGVYFGAFAKMREFLGYVPEPAEAIVKLNVAISNPYIIIPKSTSDDEHVLVDLGKITIGNTFVYGTPLPDGRPYITDDNIKVSISAMNITTNAKTPSSGSKLVKSILLNSVDMNVAVQRPALNDPKRSLPRAIVEASLSQITIDVAADKLSFLASIIAGNVSELPLRPDEEELRIVLQFLQSVNFSVLLPDDVSNLPEGRRPPSYTEAQVNFKLQQACVTIYAGTGMTYDGLSTAIARASVNNLGLQIIVESDESLDVLLDMESILLEDVRPKSTSQFKMIVSSRAASEVSAVALSSGSISPRANEASTVANEVSLKVELRPRQGYQNITVKLTRPRIYIVPSFMLALIDLGLPLIKQLLRAQEVFETRQNFGNAADAQRDVLVEEGNLKQKQLAEYQSVVKENNLLLKKLEGKLAVIQNATMSPNPQVEMAIIEEIQNAKTAHQRKIRTLRHLHQEQLKKFKGIATDLLVAASTKMESATEVLKKAASGEEVKVESPYKERRVRLMILSPEICLLKSAETSTSALVVHLGDSMVEILVHKEDKDIDFKLVDFDAYKCEIDLKTQAVTDKVLLIQPLKAAVKLLQDDVNNSLSATVDASGLQAIISYRDIRLLQTIFDTFSPLIATVESELEKEKAIVNAVAASLLGDEHAVTVGPPKPQSEPGEKLITLTVSNSMLSLLNDAQEDFIVPLFKAEYYRADLILQLLEDRTKVTSKVTALQMSSYNVDLSAYEPVLEPWEVTVMVKQDKDKTSINISTEHPLNLNVSKSLIDTVFSVKNFADTLMKAPTIETGKSPALPAANPISTPPRAGSHGPVPSSSSGGNLAAAGRSFSPFIIRNQSYRTIKYWFVGETEEKALTLEHGAELPVEGHHSTKEETAKADSKMLINIRPVGLPDPILFPEVPIDKVHVRQYATSYSDRTLVNVTQVIRRGGTKILTLRTNKTIDNSTGQDIEVLVIDGTQKDPWTKIIPAGESTSIPLTYYRYNSLAMRPVTAESDSWTWFHWKINTGGALVACKNDKTDTYWCCSLTYTPSDLDEVDDALVLRPCLIVENLFANKLLFKTSSNGGKDWEFSNSIEPGEEDSVYKSKTVVATGSAMAFQLGGYYWSKTILLPKLLEKQACPYKLPIDISHTSNTPLTIYAEVTEPYFGCIKLSVYAAYWIVNQTGLPLAYRANWRSARIGVDENRPPVDFSASPTKWYSTKDTFMSKAAAQKAYWSADEIQIQVGEGEWSSALKLETKEKTDMQEYITIPESKLNRTFAFVANVSGAPGKFWRTSEIRICPAFILVNKLPKPLVYNQYMAKPDRICELAEGEQLPFHWSDVKKDKLLVINHKDDSTNWSQKFKIDQIDTLMVKLRPRTPSLEKQYELISVTIKERDGVRFIVFRPGEDNYIELYRIVNQTTEYISLQQKGHETIDIIPPKTASAYFWEEPHVPQGRLLMMKVHNLKNGAPCVISLDVDPRTHPDWEPKNAANSKFKVQLLPRGYSRVLVIYDERDTQNSVVRELLTYKEDNPKDSLELEASIGCLSISIIDTTPAELTFVTFKGIAARVIQSDIDNFIELSIATGQVDNQIYRAPEPVLLVPIVDESVANTPGSKRDRLAIGQPEKLPKFLKLLASIDAKETKLRYVRSLYVGMQPLDIGVDQVFILKMAIFGETLAKYIGTLAADVDARVLGQEQVLPHLNDDDLQVDSYYFQNICLDMVKLVLSLRKGERPAIDASSLTATQSTVKRALDSVLTLSSIERAELGLAAFQLKNSHCSIQDFQNRLAKHYQGAFLSQLSGLIFNFVTKFARGTVIKSAIPMRPPRFFPPDNTIVLYDLEKSYGQKILRSLKFKEFTEDHYVFHYFVSKECVLLSTRYVVLLDGTTVVLWKERTSDLFSVIIDDRNMAIRIFFANIQAQKQTERVIKCRTSDQIEVLREKLLKIANDNKNDLRVSKALK